MKNFLTRSAVIAAVCLAGFSACISISLNMNGTAPVSRASASVRARAPRPVPNRAEQLSVTALLSRLDLTRPGLEKVSAASGNPSLAAQELLEYYRARTDVKHSIDRSRKASSLGNYSATGQFPTADNALRHYFIGQGSYPPYFMGEDIDWSYNPYAPDYEWVWQFNRNTYWNFMAQAYWHTGDEKYAAGWVSQLADWVRKNPPYTEWTWRSIEAGIRGYNWTYQYQHFIDSPSVTPEFLVTYLNGCFEHADYLYRTYRTGSNWSLMEAEGMIFIAIMFPEFRNAVRWRTEAVRRLNIEIDNQVLPDGYQREVTPNYHVESIAWFNRPLDLAYMNGMDSFFPESYRDKVEKMCEIIMTLGLPDGTLPVFGDSWKPDPGYYWPNLRGWADRYGREDFRYVATEGRQGVMPKETAFAYTDSGFYSMRSGWDRNAVCLILKNSPDGEGHCQQDNGTFELYAGGRYLMPDSGHYIYTGDPQNRAWFRQTQVHQTLTLNGENTNYAPKLLHWQPGNALDVLVIENASYANLTHRRAVLFVDKRYFVIVDEASGAGTGNVDIHFQLAPGESVINTSTLAGRTAFSSGWNVAVRNIISNGAVMEEEEGQVSFRALHKEPRPAFRYRVRKSTPTGVRFVTVVAPYNGNNPPDIGVELVGNPEIGANTVNLMVTANGSSRQIGYSF